MPFKSREESIPSFERAGINRARPQRTRQRRPLNASAFARQAMNKAKKPTRFENIDALVKGGGDITIGRVGPVSCAATAADGSQSLAMLVRRPRESLEALLDRLDQAIGKAWDEEKYIDEING